MAKSGRNERAGVAPRMRERGFIPVTEWIPEHYRWELEKIARQMREDRFFTSNKDHCIEEIVGEVLMAVCLNDEELSLADLRKRILALELTDLPFWRLVERRLEELSEPTSHFPAGHSGAD